jgi:hypothetical protein
MLTTPAEHGLNYNTRRNYTSAERAKIKSRHEANKAALAQWNRDVANDPSGKYREKPARLGGYRRGA